MNRRRSDPNETVDTGGARAQSEVIGVILLTGVFVVLAAVFGLYAVSNFVATGEAQPLLDADGNATTQYVTISHEGGETLRTTDLDVIVRGEGRERYDLEAFTQREGDDTSRFEPGDRFRHPNEVDGSRLTYLLIHEPSNTVVDRVEVDVVVTIAARFSTSPERPTQGETITFDASESEVRGSTLTGYEWDFGADGSVDVTGGTTRRTYADEGTYPVSLTVTAADGRTATRTRGVQVVNERPTASFTASPTLVAPGDTVSFDASGSRDDSAISSYEWDFGDGTTASGVTASQAYGSVGTYTVNLAVTDDDGAVDSATTTISVTRARFGASITGTDSPVTEGGTLTVDVEVSNTGAETGTQAVTLSINGTQEASQSVSLDAGDTTSISLDWATGPGDAQSDPYLATVATENTTDSTFVTVIQQLAILQINDVRGLTDRPSTHDYQAAVDVEETNDVETQNLAVRLAIVDGSGLEVYNQTLDSVGELENAELTTNYAIGRLSSGRYDYTVTATADNAQDTTASGSFTVQSVPVAAIDAIADQSTRCGSWNENRQRCNGQSEHAFQFQVDYSGSDDDGDLTQLAVELISPDGAVVDAATTDYGGVSSASETETLTYTSQSDWNQDVTIRVTATDSHGNTDVVTQTETADGA